MNWQLKPKHIVQCALHPTHILRTGWRGFGGIGLRFDGGPIERDAISPIDHTPGPPTRIGGETRWWKWRNLRLARTGDWLRSGPVGHHPPRARCKTLVVRS